MTIWEWLAKLIRPKPPVPPPAGTPLARLLALHNAERAKHGLPPLKRDAQLEAAAQVWALRMSNSGVLSHADFAGRITAQGYRWRACAENIAFGDQTADTVFGTWMRSGGHRANILGRYADVGFGHMIDARGQHWWCADFGSK